jgi:lipopolysaccharide/colanic/teichoic acid biosynthesis glycosyltransferase
MSTSPSSEAGAVPARTRPRDTEGADLVVPVETQEHAIRRRVAGHPRTARALKRVGDVALAASGLAVTAPLVAVLAALVRLDSPGATFFFQRRTGLDQRPFTLVKLRTMDDAQRVTRVGLWLRPLGLDELPQLWNVLRGDMSLVGPRPEVPQRVEGLRRRLPAYDARHFVRPGITGWAQVNGLRGDISPPAERLRRDLEYLHDWNLALDLRILLRTASAVWRDTVRSRRG